MKKTILYFLLIFLSSSAFSQFSIPIKTDAVECKNRTLLVELKEKEQKVLDKYKRKGLFQEQMEYLAKIEAYNQNIQDMVNKYWKLNKNILYKTTQEIEELVNIDNHKYIVFSSGWRGEKSVVGSGISMTKYFTFSLYFSEKFKKRNQYEIDKSGKMTVSRGPYIFKISIPSNLLSEADYKFIIDQFNYNINYATELGEKSNFWGFFQLPKCGASNYEKARNAILLIPKEMLHSDLSITDIGKIYEYKFIVISLRENDSMVLNSLKNHIYFHFAWSDNIRDIAYVICDCETGAPIIEMTSGSSGFVLLGIPSSKPGYVSPLLSMRQQIAIKEEHFTTLNGLIKNNGDFNIFDYYKARRNDKKKLKK
jgi:hypothetical protein